MFHLRTAGTALALVGAMTGGAVAASGPAFAISAPIHIAGTSGQGVNLRPGPNTSGSPVGWMPEGASPDYTCFAYGQNVGNVPVWFLVNYNGHTGYYASYYDDSHYTSGADLTAKYGIPQCGSAPAVTAAQQSAINWARHYADTGSTAYSGLCLTFVFDAYSQAGVNLRSQVTVGIGSDTYPVDIWNHFSAGRTGVGTPPAGALVFYASNSGNRTYSHVTLSVGGGNTVSTSDSLGSRIHYESAGSTSTRTYLGWWLPAS